MTCAACGPQGEHYIVSSRADYTCPQCGAPCEKQVLTARPKSAVFPFVTPHVDGKGRPMVIEDIGHLRRVEREYGVTLTAFSQNPSNPAAIQDAPRYRGQEPHLMKRDPRAR